MSQAEQNSSFTTVTSSYLLEGLKSPENHTVWQQFVDRYQPLIVGYARRLGLGEQDAQDAAQQTLMAFCQAYQDGKYQRERGRLRSWLFGIAHRQILNFMRRQRGKQVSIGSDSQGTDVFAQAPSERRLEDLWEQEWQEGVLRECLAQVRREFDPKTVQAFELFAWKGVPAEQVAEQLDMTANAVFLAKRRVLKRIREILPRIAELW